MDLATVEVVKLCSTLCPEQRVYSHKKLLLLWKLKISSVWLPLWLPHPIPTPH